MRSQIAEVSVPIGMSERNASRAIIGTFERMGYADYIDEPIFIDDFEERRQHHGETHFVVMTNILFKEDMGLPERLDIRWIDKVNICWGERYF